MAIQPPSDPAPYAMALCRPQTRSIFDGEGRAQRDIFDANIDHYCALIGRAAGEHGARLIVFPQFALTGYTPLGTAGWHDAAISFPGPEIDRIAESARAANAYVLVQTAERHAAFAGRYFLSAAILTPDGTVGLVHRKNYAISLRTSPVDVHDRFVEAFGADAFHPVLDTPLGVMGVAIGAELHWPEAVRALALKGAEIVLNPVAAAPALDYMGRPGAQIVRPVRAFENMVYLGMANIAADGAPAAQAYDYNGGTIGRRTDDAGFFTVADIDMGALRAARRVPAANFLAQIQGAIHEPLARLPSWPLNSFADAPAATADQLIGIEAASWERMRAEGRGR